jgi:hypothetical protein
VWANPASGSPGDVIGEPVAYGSAHAAQSRRGLADLTMNFCSYCYSFFGFLSGEFFFKH